MSEVQEVISIIANAADYVGDKAFAIALRELKTDLESVPSYEHLNVLKMAWGEVDNA